MSLFMQLALINIFLKILIRCLRTLVLEFYSFYDFLKKFILWNYSIIVIESTILIKTSAVGLDYFYFLDLPPEMTSEKMSEFGGDLEYR